METIRKVTSKLVNKLIIPCPNCKLPGFGHSRSIDTSSDLMTVQQVDSSPIKPTCLNCGFSEAS